jgi:transposase-like protein
MWSRRYPPRILVSETGIDKKTVIDWRNFVRDVCCRWCIYSPPILGGLNEELEGKTVELDESAFGKRKYHRGRKTKILWVLGGIERGSKKCFLQIVKDRKAETLIPIIQSYVAPGTRIITDGWSSYNDLHSVDGGIYSHDVVVHDTHFVNPSDCDVHTQNIETLWSRAKRMLKRQTPSTSAALFPSYLREFMWRESLPSKCDCFVAILHEISVQYPL